MSRTRLVLMPALAGEPAPWLIVDAAGTVLERGLLSLESPAVGPAIRTVAVVPGADVLIRWLDLPPGNVAQQRAAALWALKDDLAATPERVRLSLGRAVAGEPRLAAVVSDPLVQAWTDYLTSLGLRADALVPDCLTVPEPVDPAVLAAVGFGPSLALRGHRFAASVEPDLAELIAGDRTIVAVEDGAQVERMLIQAALNPPIDLLSSGGRATGEGLRPWRRAMALAAAVVIAPLVITLALAARDDLAAREDRRASEAAARRAFPDMAPGVDPVAEAERRLATAAPPGGVAVAAAVLFAALEGVEGAELDSLNADPAGGVRATVSYPAYQDLEAMQSAVAAAGLMLTDTSTIDDNGRVVSDVVIGAGA